MTQTELANKLFVTEKAVSRWETGRGTPDISLLIPLSKELNIDVSELLNGDENNIEKVIEYIDLKKDFGKRCATSLTSPFNFSPQFVQHNL